MTRKVVLPEGIAGSLYLSEMPGRSGPLEGFLQDMAELGVDEVISLAPMDEILEKSPSYARLLGEGGLGRRFVCFPVPDFGVPRDEAAFAREAERVAGLVSCGGRILVHCGAGIGRTGTFALSILAAMGMPGGDASNAVSAAGSGPETAGQTDMVDRLRALFAGVR